MRTWIKWTTGTAGRRLVALAFVAFVALGVPNGALGTAWPSIRGDFGRPLADLGVLLIALTAGNVVSGALAGRATDRFGRGPLLAMASVAAALALIVFSTAASWPAVVAAVLVLGAGKGLIDAGVNAHVAVNHGVRVMNLLHASFGVGSTLGPLLVAALVAGGGSWRVAFALLAVLDIVLVLAFWRTRSGWSAGVLALTDGAVRPGPPRTGGRLLVTTLVLFFLYTGVEVGTGQWAFTLLTEGRGMSVGIGGAWVAAYWGGLTVGRVAVGLAGSRRRPVSILNGSMVVSLVGLVLLWADPWGVGAFGLPVTGLGLAAVFPTLVSLAPARFGAERMAAIVGYQIAAAALGAALLPYAAGLAAEVWGLEVIAPVVFVGAVAMGCLHLVTVRLAGERLVSASRGRV